MLPVSRTHFFAISITTSAALLLLVTAFYVADPRRSAGNWLVTSDIDALSKWLDIGLPYLAEVVPKNAATYEAYWNRRGACKIGFSIQPEQFDEWVGLTGHKAHYVGRRDVTAPHRMAFITAEWNDVEMIIKKVPYNNTVPNGDRRVSQMKMFFSKKEASGVCEIIIVPNDKATNWGQGSNNRK